MKNAPRYGLLLLLVAIAGFFLAVRPQIAKFSQNSLKYKVREIERKSYEARIKHLNEIKLKPNIEKVLNARYLALPKSSQVPEVLVMVEDFGNNSGVVLTTASVGKPSSNEVPVVLSFTGKYPNLTGFLDLLYQNIRTVKIKSQTVSTDKDGNLVVNLNLGLVYQGAEKETTAKANEEVVQ